MILRRLMHHMKDQNWFAVGLDLIVVIVGIFLGMQVNNWNEARKERQAETSYLHRIIEDLDTAQEMTQNHIQRMEGWIAGSIATLSALQDPSLPMPENAGYYFSRATQIDPSIPTISAIKELQADGKMSIISNETLRAQIVQGDSQMENLWQLRNNLVAYVTTIVPIIQTRLRRDYDKSDLSIVSFDRAALSQDTEFMNAFAYAIRNLRFNLTWMKDTQTISHDLSLAAQAELTRLAMEGERLR